MSSAIHPQQYDNYRPISFIYSRRVNIQRYRPVSNITSNSFQINVTASRKETNPHAYAQGLVPYSNQRCQSDPMALLGPDYAFSPVLPFFLDFGFFALPASGNAKRSLSSALSTSTRTVPPLASLPNNSSSASGRLMLS